MSAEPTRAAMDAISRLPGKRWAWLMPSDRSNSSVGFLSSLRISNFCLYRNERNTIEEIRTRLTLKYSRLSQGQCFLIRNSAPIHPAGGLGQRKITKIEVPQKVGQTRNQRIIPTLRDVF